MIQLYEANSTATEARFPEADFETGNSSRLSVKRLGVERKKATLSGRFLYVIKNRQYLLSPLFDYHHLRKFNRYVQYPNVFFETSLSCRLSH